MNGDVIRLDGYANRGSNSLHFELVPISSLRSGRIRAVAVEGRSLKEPRTLSCARLWTESLYGLIVELQEFGVVSEAHPAFFTLSSEEIRDEECWENLKRAASRNTVMMCSTTSVGECDGEHGNDYELARAVERLKELSGRSRSGAGLRLRRKPGPEVDMANLNYVLLENSLLEDSVTHGDRYMGLLQVVSLCRLRGAKIILGWVGRLPERRLAMGVGAEYGLGWPWARRFGWLHTLGGGVGLEHWSDESRVAASGEGAC